MKRVRPYLGIAAVCWALAIMPALCTGGILLHHCECEHAGHQDECGHEVECEIDPCGDVIARPSDGCDGTIELKWPDVALEISLFTTQSTIVPPIIWSSPPLVLASSSILYPLTNTILLI